MIRHTIQLVMGMVCVMLLGTVTALGQVTYNGNGNSGFGGPLGNGSFEISDDGTTISIEFTRGGTGFYDALVIYIDSESGGITNTSNLTDIGDGLRKGISGYDGTNRSTVNFPSGFQPDYAIAANVSTDDGINFAGIWKIVESGSHSYTASADISSTSETAASFTMTVDFSELGITSSDSFSFLATYLNQDNAFRSDEGIGKVSSLSNPGQSSITYTTFFNYDSGDETIPLSVTGTEGWRMFSTPTSDNTYDDLLGGLWTQGIATGADATEGDASVQTYNGSAFTAVSDLTSTMTPGAGFITYVYSDDDYTNSGADTGFPKTLSVSGTENTGSVSPTLTSGADAWTLVGNPYASTVDWDNLTKTDLTGTVYVYDHSYGTPTSPDAVAGGSAGSYRVWNGTDGSLTDGLIAPFQGFWVQNSASATSEALTFEEEDKTAGGTFHKSADKPVSIQLHGEMEGMTSETFLSFTENGRIEKDNFDGLTLSPLDFRDYLSVATVTGDTKLDINNLPDAFNGELVIPVSIEAFRANEETHGWEQREGTVTLSWPTMRNVPDNWTIILHDYQQGTTTDMRQASSYELSLEGDASKAKRAPSMSILNPQPPQTERLAKGTDAPRLGITITANTSVSNESGETPEAFALEQNYPNPFNPTTSIQYSVANAGEVQLTVYNVMGQQVETLVSGTKSAGTYRVSWDAANMASGIYYYRLQAGNQVVTRQMTLIK